MKNNKIRYIKVKNGVISIHMTSNFKRVMEEEFGAMAYDTTDYIFNENLDIRIFVEDLNLENKDVCINYYYNNELWTTFNGTVLFAKDGVTKFRSLSKKDINIIINNLIPTCDSEFNIYAKQYNT